MGLYVSITLLAALTVTNEHASDIDVLAIVWGTTVGLALAHWFAFGLAARLVDPAHEHEGLNGLLVAQLGAAAAVAAVASVPVLVLPEDLELVGARLATDACIAIVTYSETRSFGASKLRAITSAVIALALALAISIVKQVIAH